MKWRSYENNFQEYKTDLPDKTIQWAQSKGWGFRGKIRQKHLDLERAKILDSQLLLFDEIKLDHSSSILDILFSKLISLSLI
jgi:hypothetical protein